MCLDADILGIVAPLWRNEMGLSKCRIGPRLLYAH